MWGRSGQAQAPLAGAARGGWPRPVEPRRVLKAQLHRQVPSWTEVPVLRSRLSHAGGS